MSDISPKGSLPYGWQVRISKRYPNKVYYFNIETGDSTWECPQLDPPRVLQEKQDNISLLKEVAKVLEKSKDVANGSMLTKNVPVDHASTEPKKINEVSNSKKILKDYPSNSVERGLKPNVPPTAIVAPVVQNFDKKAITSKLENRLKVPPSKKRALLVEDHQEPVQKKQIVESCASSSSLVGHSSNTKRQKKKKNKKRPLTGDISATSVKKGVVESAARRAVEVDESTSRRAVEVVESTSRKAVEVSQSATTVPPSINDKDTDIEMLDVSMECMDELTSNNDTIFDSLAKYYIVVDTNILISKLSLIDELKDTPVDGCGPPHIFIPWVVIEELDKLKSNRSLKEKGTMRAACEAIRYLNKVLSKHPRFHGQSPFEAEKWAKSYSKVNDDKILECCMALGDKMSKEKVILLTNDKNLVNKALICNINVHDFESMMKKIKPDIAFNGTKQNGKRKNDDKVVVKEAGSSESSNNDKEITLNAMHCKRDFCKRDIHTLMSSARQLLKNVLTEFLKSSMLEAYGQIWTSFPIETKLLKGILAGIKRYWNMVFSEFLNEKDKRNFELLYEKASRPEGFLGDKEECLIILSAIEDVFRLVKRKYPKSDVPIEEIQDLRVLCVKVFLIFNDVENSIREAEFNDVYAVFEQNWGVINQLCGFVADFCKVRHDFQYEKPEQIPSEAEFRRLMCNLYPAVKDLNEAMTFMVDVVTNNKPTKTASRKLAKALLQLIPSLNIPCELVPHPHFSQKALERFFTYPQNKQMIEIGLRQIEKFYSKIDESLSAMMKVGFDRGGSSPETMLLD